MLNTLESIKPDLIPIPNQHPRTARFTKRAQAQHGNHAELHASGAATGLFATDWRFRKIWLRCSVDPCGIMLGMRLQAGCRIKQPPDHLKPMNSAHLGHPPSPRQ